MIMMMKVNIGECRGKITKGEGRRGVRLGERRKKGWDEK